MHAIFRRAVKVYGLPHNPLANVDRYRVRRSGDIEVFSPEEVWSLVRAAASETDGAIFLTAAFTGVRRGASCSGSAGAISTSTLRRSACGQVTRRGS